jgi:hypothetical protein
MLRDPFGKPLVKTESQSTPEQKKSKRALLRRSKDVEREFARWLTSEDGFDEKYRNLTSSTGRIGQITGIQADILSVHYLGEAKNEKFPLKWLRYWHKIVQKSTEWRKDPILLILPPNRAEVDPKLPALHIITPERHAELLRKEKYYDEHDGDAEAKFLQPINPDPTTKIAKEIKNGRK